MSIYTARAAWQDNENDGEILRKKAIGSAMSRQLTHLEDSLNLLDESIDNIIKDFGPYMKPEDDGEDASSDPSDSNGYDRSVHSYGTNRVYDITIAVDSMRRHLDNVSERLEL